MKRDVVNKIAANTGMTIVDSEKAFDATFKAVEEVLIETDKVRVPRFGVFTRKFRDSRNVRNPRTGEMITTTGKHFIHFKESQSEK